MRIQDFKELRDQATGVVASTAANVAMDPLRAARGLAGSGAKTALRLPARAGLAATGPALEAVTRALAVAGSAVRTGRAARDRLLPGRGHSAWSGPVAAESERDQQPLRMAPPPGTEAPTEAPLVDTPGASTEATLVGAPGTADEAVARAERAVGGAAPSGASLDHGDLPLEDYDHLTLPALRARLARIDLTGLVQLRDYEKAHANRLPVVTMLENRIAKVTATA